MKADDLFKRDLMILVAFFVEEHGAGSIGRVGVGDKGNFLIRIGSADGFVHGDGGGKCFAVIRDVIRRDGMFLS